MKHDMIHKRMGKSERQPQGYKFYILRIKKYKKELQNLIKKMMSTVKYISIISHILNFLLQFTIFLTFRKDLPQFAYGNKLEAGDH